MIWGDIVIPDNLTIHVHLHDADEGGLSAKIDRLTALVETVLKKGKIMSQQMDDLTREVQETGEVQASAIVLLEGLSAQILEFKNNPEALQKLADDLDRSATSLADAIVANTPAVVEPPIEPPVEPLPVE